MDDAPCIAAEPQIDNTHTLTNSQPLEPAGLRALIIKAAGTLRVGWHMKITNSVTCDFCHGRGRGFEPRRPSGHLSQLLFLYFNKELRRFLA